MRGRKHVLTRTKTYVSLLDLPSHLCTTGERTRAAFIMPKAQVKNFEQGITTDWGLGHNTKGNSTDGDCESLVKFVAKTTINPFSVADGTVRVAWLSFLLR